MIARLTVGVPFKIALPDGANFTLFSYEEDGYVIEARPPVRSDQPMVGDAPSDVTLDGAKAFLANALQFDFHKSDFDRRRSDTSMDPPLALMQRVVDGFIARFRYVARAAHVHSVSLGGGATWRLEYLADDESELPAAPGLSRAVGAVAVAVSFTSVTPAVWESVHKMSANWRPPVWDDILLDAFNALPAIGTAVVLGATALEVFIADILERLATNGDVPRDVWGWINDRDDWSNNPSTEEQFDILLRHFLGHSLKDHTHLWQAFRELRTARNKFVHEGVPRIGGKEVTVEKARQLLRAANEVIESVREWLPTEMQWSQTQADATVGFSIPLLRSPST